MDDRSIGIIETALRKGAKLHTFLSGGWLRVVRLENAGRLVGYGEAPTVEDALVHVAEDFAAGGRPYHEVYGKFHPHYLTGQSTPTGPLDTWVRQGRTFDAIATPDGFTVDLRGYGETRVPKDAEVRALAGDTVQWESRGYTYETAPGRSPTGERCVATRVIGSPPWERSRAGRGGPWMYNITQSATAPTLAAAIEAALAAEPIEVAA